MEKASCERVGVLIPVSVAPSGFCNLVTLVKDAFTVRFTRRFCHQTGNLVAIGVPWQCTAFPPQRQPHVRRMLELQEGRTHFNKRERNKKEKDEQKDNADKGASQKAHLKPPSPPRTLASPTASVTVSSGSLSMHSSNPKVRNSPSGNTQR
ncbi:unnamed protein product [Ranitomeya imitator]|uniref:Uncharacterized protein n=1 Tax=Ranitomeya imitator TaxID=111125 RepID=A0ABN9LBJ7_9NEOB|nr:unnamed protein product [Ranitomeya imitator]